MIDYNALAQMLLEGRTFALSVSEGHLADYGLPSTKMAKTHNIRSVVQALIVGGTIGGFRLEEAYTAFGKVELEHLPSRIHLLLKARRAMPIEISYQPTFFESIDALPPGAGPLSLLLYEFGPHALTLSTAPAESVRHNGRRRYQLLGEVEFQGEWSYDGGGGDAPAPVFDQGGPDDFGDLSEDVRFLGQEEL